MSTAIRGLDRLSLVHTGLTADFLERMPTTVPFTRLRSISLAGNPLGDHIDLTDLLGWLPESLVRLGLADCGLGDRAAARLAASPAIRRLHALDLSRNAITDISALMLADSPNLIGSTRLDLSGNPISRRVQNALRIRLGHHVVV
jgi:Leucine-rich repeat (LRR) protein